jgi:large conductance mechanosensitive channel
MLHSDAANAASAVCIIWPEHRSDIQALEEARMKGFKEFLLRGNVLDLAVAVVIGAAFTAVVTALVKDLLTPIVGAIIGKPDFSALVVDVNGSKLLVGDFLNAVIAFVMMAAAVYFFVVLPVNTIVARMRRGEAPSDPTTKKCPECLSEVAIAARRCAFCTSPLTS